MKKPVGGDAVLVTLPVFMKHVRVPMLLLVLSCFSAFAQERAPSRTPRGVMIVFADTMRLTSREGQSTLDDFRYYLEKIREIAKREFPDVELKVLDRGELVTLPDGTRFNSTNARVPLGLVFSARGKKRIELYGVQTEVDFACTAASFFQRPSPSCPKAPANTVPPTKPPKR